jgi:hypothetical protein
VYVLARLRAMDTLVCSRAGLLARNWYFEMQVRRFPRVSAFCQIILNHGASTSLYVIGKAKNGLNLRVSVSAAVESITSFCDLRAISVKSMIRRLETAESNVNVA